MSTLDELKVELADWTIKREQTIGSGANNRYAAHKIRELKIRLHRLEFSGLSDEHKFNRGEN